MKLKTRKYFNMKFLAILAIVVVGASCMLSQIDNSLGADWEAYKIEHNKNYKDLDEKISRYAETNNFRTSEFDFKFF